ncbi:metallo-hydrolase family protein [Sphingorhabdus sp. IMCC26285]|uniref:beta-lactamase n=1 Tax=Sphingorhabdus profundilacus TaxID=2509718 RepID=A0A6I4LZR0_9SPHN|nr:serine hydrolase [Sphingorhabdus profundilacus]MVZ98511.1 metallo-hydrolase family protein [Sphingorhabdus profundilacus]
MFYQNAKYLRFFRSTGGAAIAWLAIVSMLTACVAADPLPLPKPKTNAPISKPAAKPSLASIPKPPPPVSPKPAAVPPIGLENLIQEQWKQFPGKTGVAILRIDGGEWVIGRRLDELFPQQSVSKTWVALTILDLVDQGKLRLDQKVRITADDIAVFHQPIRERVLAKGPIDESVQSLLEQSITASDNTANDSLLRTAGGPQVVRSFIARKKLGAIRFGPGERVMQSEIAGLQWKQEYSVGRRFYSAREELPLAQRKAALDRYLADPVDGASPVAIVRALGKLARGELLSPTSTRLLLDIMSRTSSGPNRLKAGVPVGWKFVHKTGTGQILSPISTGYNDIGIMTAPDGTRYAMAVMIGSTTASIPERMAFMQFVSRTVATYHQR